nr:hypothetical protein [uncultured Cellulosilyticum sp.]
MNKKQQLLNYLDENLFNPIISAPYASSQLKEDFSHTREVLKDFSAEGILYYIWNSFANKDTEAVISHRLMDEGFSSYNQVLDTFKQEFSYEWLIS